MKKTICRVISVWDKLLQSKTTGGDNSHPIRRKPEPSARTVDELEFFDGITCVDLFAWNDPRKRIAVFRVI